MPMAKGAVLVVFSLPSDLPPDESVSLLRCDRQARQAQPMALTAKQPAGP